MQRQRQKEMAAPQHLEGTQGTSSTLLSGCINITKKVIQSCLVMGSPGDAAAPQALCLSGCRLNQLVPWTSLRCETYGRSVLCNRQT